MRVLHCCLSNWYVDGWSYQENELISKHQQNGHEVLVLASTESPDEFGKLSYLNAGKYVGLEGSLVQRISYRRGPTKLMRKVRAYPGVYKILQDFKPDAILFHGACGYEVITVARYVRQNPGVIFYIDSHEDWNNSARTFLSREILHKLFYRFCLRRAWPIARKILAISTETMEFVHDTYGVPKSHIEFFPLGGTILSDADYIAARTRERTRLGVANSEIMFVQAGKQTLAKKLLESLRAFAGATNAKLFIAGSIDPCIHAEAMGLIEANPNVTFLGWQSAAQVTDLLCAADVYLQPGTQSVTMQNSLCCRCVPIIADVPSHQVYVNGNGWLVSDQAGLELAVRAACHADLAQMSAQSLDVARRILDYAQLSQRVLR